MNSTASPTVSMLRAASLSIDIELFLETGHQLDRLGALGAQVEDEVAVVFNDVLFDIEHRADDLDDPFPDFALFHLPLQSSKNPRPIR